VERASEPPRAAHAIALAALAAFALLTLAVLDGGAPGWDHTIFRELYSGATTGPPGAAPNDSALLDALMPWIFRTADGRAILVLTVVVLGALVIARRPRDAAFVAAACAIALAAGVLKELLARPAPFESHGGTSFPSGHAMGSLAMALSLVLIIDPWLRPLAAVAGATFVIAVAIAVVADGGHWPSDILGGWLLAVAWVVVIMRVFRITPRST
jgi:undecaprenyl-diphosphatase